MKIIDRLRLFILEEKLKLGAFGKYNRYRCRCLERNVTSVVEKLSLAREILSGPGVGLTESQHNADFIRREYKKIAREDLPMTQEPDDDGFDSYRLAMAMEIMKHDSGPMIGHIDDEGNLFVKPWGEQ